MREELLGRVSIYLTCLTPREKGGKADSRKNVEVTKKRKKKTWRRTRARRD